MQLAYTIQCHKSSLQVNRLIERLDNYNTDFYIHVDKKSTIMDEIIKKDNIFLVESDERIDIK